MECSSPEPGHAPQGGFHALISKAGFLQRLEQQRPLAIGQWRSVELAQKLCGLSPHFSSEFSEPSHARGPLNVTRKPIHTSMELFKDCMILERRLSHFLLLIAHAMLPSIISRLTKFHQQLGELCMLVDGLFHRHHFQSSAPESSEVENDIPDPIHSVATNTSSSQGSHLATLTGSRVRQPFRVVILHPPRIFTPLLFWLYCLLIPVYQYVVILHFSELLSAVSDEDPLFFE